MKDRPLLEKKGKLSILIDSESVETLLSSGEEGAQNLLKYSGTVPFEFLRSPFESVHDELERILSFEKIYDKGGQMDGIEIIRSPSSMESMLFPYKLSSIYTLGFAVLDRKTLTDDERDAIILALVLTVLDRERHNKILVTNNSFLLRNRFLLEHRFLDRGLNIVTVEEAREIMDLFAKYQNTYLTAPHNTCNKGSWYWLSMRNKVPHYHVGKPLLNALANRLVFLLMSVDEMGFQYYSGVNNDTLDSTVYHFNYAITLMTGVFDSLALETKDHFDLHFGGEKIPGRTSLNPRIGRNFLRALKQTNPVLREHVHSHVAFIKLVYRLRETVLHREMLKQSAFQDENEKWEANFVTIDSDISNLIRSCGDRSEEHRPFTHWGRYKIYTYDFLEPFHFSKSAVRKLASFCDEYLKLLGYEDYMQQMREGEQPARFLNELEQFSEGNLRG